MAVGKTDLVKIINSKSSLSQKQASEFIDAFIETVEEKLSQGERVQLTGFGTFSSRKRASREGRKPGTGEKITIPESTTAVFKPGKDLKEKLNK